MKSALSVLDFADYRSFLEAEYLWQKANNRKFSLRYFASRAKIRSYTSLKYVIEKKRHLSYELLHQFISALGLNDLEAQYFELLWKHETAKSETQKIAVQIQIEKFRASQSDRSRRIQRTLRQARLYYEKCQFEDSRSEFKKALELATLARELPSSFEALAGIIGVLNDLNEINELKETSKQVDFIYKNLAGSAPPAFYWYCRARLAQAEDDLHSAQRYLLSFLRSARDQASQFSPAQTFSAESAQALAWVYLANIQCDLKKWKRAELLCKALLNKYEESSLRGVTGYALTFLGLVMESKKDFVLSQIYHERAHSKFRQEQNWYCSLYALLSYARVARLKGDLVRSEAYLEIARRSVPVEFRSLIQVLEKETKRLRNAF